MKVTGLEKGGLYRHFASKEQLAAEAFDFAWQSAFEERTRGIESTPNSVDKLKQFIANFVDRRPLMPGGCPIFNTAIEADDGNRLLRDRARRALSQLVTLLTGITETGIRRKEVLANTDAASLALLIISSLEGALTISRLERDRRALTSTRTYMQEHLESHVRLRSLSRTANG
jgi:TetR/AcrR family transcriptional repressor of nem operon